jgi:protein-arginine kinase activator protein McsA
MTEQEKEEHQERVFTYYYDRNNMDIELAIEELETDLIVLEEQEQYERCALLRDVLDRVRN